MSDEKKKNKDSANKATKNVAGKAKEKATELKKDAKEVLEDAKGAAKKATGKAKAKAAELKEEAKDAFEDVKEEAKEFTEDAKETAKEFKDNIKETLDSKENKKLLAGILAIILGSLGIHKFILGYQKEGFILLAITILGYATSCLAVGLFFVWIPGLIGLIEGIIYLTKSDEEFYQTYQMNKKPWF